MSPRRHAFTLIELLVVILIIAVLAALLFPTLGVVMSISRQTKCASNQRQIGLGTLAYAMDNNDVLPPANGYNGAQPWWPATVASYVDERGNQQGFQSKRTSSVVWGCPIWTKSYQLGLMGSGWWYDVYAENTTGYGMQMAWRVSPDSNQWLVNSWTFIDASHTWNGMSTSFWARRETNPFCGLTRMSLVPYDSSQPLLIDYVYNDIHPWWHDYIPGDRARHVQRHRGRGNCLFLDGHVAAVTHHQWGQAVDTPWN